jgi:ketosteroid isomerase-like protein
MHKLLLLSFARIFPLACCIVLLSVPGFSQEKKVAATSEVLQRELEKMDSLLFGAYNARNIEKLKSYFTEDLEWYQDNGGLLSFQTVLNNFEGLFKRDYILTRTLVKGSMKVHPIKDFGAIQTGSHQFSHTENGKLEVGTFKFLMIWKKGDKGWQVSRVVSYDH